MATSKGWRGYNAYLRKAKKKFGLSHSQARAMYRAQSAHAGEPINSRAIDVHPRIAKRFADIAKTPIRKRKSVTGMAGQSRTGTSAGAAGIAPRKSGGISSPVAQKTSKRIRTIREWDDFYDQADAYEDLILNAGVDTGRAKGK